MWADKELKLWCPTALLLALLHISHWDHALVFTEELSQHRGILRKLLIVFRWISKEQLLNQRYQRLSVMDK